MKRTNLIIVGLVILVTACSPKDQMKDILNNTENKQMVYGKIANDAFLMREFMNFVQDDPEALVLLKRDTSLINTILDTDQVVKLLNNNSRAKKNIMALLLADSDMTKDMFEKALQNKSNVEQMGTYLESNNFLSQSCLEELKKSLE